MKLAINQATTMKTDFETDIRAYSKAGFESIEIWLPKLKKYLSEGGSLSQVKKLLTENNLKPVGACFQANLMLFSGKPQEEVMKEFSENLEICRSLEIPILIVPADAVSPVEEKHYVEAAENLSKAARIAEKFSVNLALEFLARSRFIGCLSTAKEIVRKTRCSNVGILFDTFHFYCGISKIEDIESVKGEEVFFVHLNDVSEKPREILKDSDRVLPCEGVLPLETIISKLKKIGYDGYYSLELFSEKLWEKEPYSAAKQCFESLEKLRRKL